MLRQEGKVSVQSSVGITTEYHGTLLRSTNLNCPKVGWSEWLQRQGWVSNLIGGCFTHGLRLSLLCKSAGSNLFVILCLKSKYKLLYLISNKTKRCEEQVTWTKNIRHSAVKFEANEKNTIIRKRVLLLCDPQSASNYCLSK